MAADRPDDQDPARALGSALRDLQRRSGCTLRALETSVRISDSSLSRYFLGTTVPPWSTVSALCQALDGDPVEYRHLWEAADRSQRKPVQSAGTKEADAPEDGDGAADVAPPEPARRRRSVASGPPAWALAGAVIGLVIGAVSTALVQSRTPAGDGGAPSGAHSTHSAQGARGASAVADVSRIFVNRATGTCLDDSLDRGTRSFECNGMSYQRWTVRTAADGSKQLRSHATGECLGHHPDGLSTTACGSSASQRWTVSAPDDDTAVEVRSTTAAARCLADSAGGLRVLPCDGTTRQKWA